MISPTRYLLFIDECGTHDLNHIDPAFPIFVLVGLLTNERYYAKTFVPSIKRLKMRHFGTADVILHSRDIRRLDGPFKVLRETPALKQAFYKDVNQLISELRFRLVAVAIDKNRLRDRFVVPLNPYFISLSQLLSLVCGASARPRFRQWCVSSIIAESRGPRREDKELQGEYQDYRKHGLWNYGAVGIQNRTPSMVARMFPDRVQFVKKQTGVSGLELADLTAYPIARAIVNGDWGNPAAQIVNRKLRELIIFP